MKELLKIKNEEIEFVLTNFEKIKCYGFSGSENAKYKFFWNDSNKGVISVKKEKLNFILREGFKKNREKEEMLNNIVLQLYPEFWEDVEKGAKIIDVIEPKIF